MENNTSLYYDFSDTFQKIRELFSKKEYLEEFREYSKNKRDNGIPENARYFFFIAREKVLESQDLFRKFYNYLEEKQPQFLYQIYWGKKKRIIEETSGKEEAWWQR